MPGLPERRKMSLCQPIKMKENVGLQACKRGQRITISKKPDCRRTKNRNRSSVKPTLSAKCCSQLAIFVCYLVIFRCILDVGKVAGGVEIRSRSTGNGIRKSRVVVRGLPCPNPEMRRSPVHSDKASMNGLPAVCGQAGNSGRYRFHKLRRGIAGAVKY